MPIMVTSLTSKLPYDHLICFDCGHNQFHATVEADKSSPSLVIITSLVCVECGRSLLLYKIGEEEDNE